MGTPVIVENRAGANGAIGNTYVARSKPDGYTLVIASAATHTVGAALAKGLPYDPVKDFEAVSNFGVIAPMLVVNADSPARTVDDLVNQARAAPGKLNYGVSSQTPGGGGDTQSRMLATALAADLGQPVLVDNRAGANGALGSRAAATANNAAKRLSAGSLRSRIGRSPG
jgi:tripartite-type tricarboxylate transporter receptor subunit TctC